MQSFFSGIKQREADTPLLLPLLLLAIGSVVYGLSQVVRDLEFDFLLMISLGAMLLSWVFARMKISGWLAGLLILLIGVFLIFFWVGDLWSPVKNSFSVVDDLLKQLVSIAGDSSEKPDFDWSSLRVIKVRVENLILELSFWFRPLIAGRPVYNYTANALLWGVAIWSVSAWAGWFQLRFKSSLIAVLPAGLLLMISMGYTYGRTTALYPFIFSVLLLTAMTFYSRSESRWKARNMDYPKED